MISTSKKPNPNQDFIDAFFQQTCNNRRLAQLNNVPPDRYDNLSSNPYLPINGGFTADQLNMRRKAEILTYNSNRMSKSNALTKTQKYSALINHSKTTLPINNQCFTDLVTGQIITTPTSSCNVPGPIMMLYNDQTIPLYNFTLGNNTKSVPQTKDTNYYYR